MKKPSTIKITIVIAILILFFIYYQNTFITPFSQNNQIENNPAQLDKQADNAKPSNRESDLYISKINENGLVFSNQMKILSDDIPDRVITGITDNGEEIIFGGPQKIKNAMLSPNNKNVVIATSGSAHGFAYIYNIESQKINPIAFSFGGSIEIDSWQSENEIALKIKTPKPSTQTKIFNIKELSEFPKIEYTSLDIYIQDKKLARDNDCGATKKITYEAPQTRSVADASLKFLFDKELFRYGEYKSVSIQESVAKVIIERDRPKESMSSCEKRHLNSVLRDTLTQYESINSIDIVTSG